MLSIYYYEKEKNVRERLNDLEEAGYCTICARGLYPINHDGKEPECQKSKRDFPRKVATENQALKKTLEP